VDLTLPFSTFEQLLFRRLPLWLFLASHAHHSSM
jgi:hypothetical protein